jgi:periplasmic divalent cation tolerance protein
MLVVLTNMPDGEHARLLATTLVERRLAACVNVLGTAVSCYHWQGAVEHAEEVPVLIKTRGALYGDVEAAIIELHPYELPEIIALPVARGLQRYLDWVSAETRVAIG